MGKGRQHLQWDTDPGKELRQKPTQHTGFVNLYLSEPQGGLFPFSKGISFCFEDEKVCVDWLTLPLLFRIQAVKFTISFGLNYNPRDSHLQFPCPTGSGDQGL